MSGIIERNPVLKLYAESRYLEFLEAAKPVLEDAKGADADAILYYCALANKKLGQVQLAMDEFRSVVQNRKANNDYIASSLIQLGIWALTSRDYDYSDACLHEYLNTRDHSVTTGNCWKQSLNAIQLGKSDLSQLVKSMLQSNVDLDSMDFICTALSILDQHRQLLPIIEVNPNWSSSPLFLSTASQCCIDLGDSEKALWFANRYRLCNQTPFIEVKADFLLLQIQMLRDSESNSIVNQAQQILVKLRGQPRQQVGNMFEFCSKVISSKTGFSRILVSRRYGMIGESPQLEQVREQIDLYANSDLNVLIRGDSGTGKELVAIALHQNSRRRDQGFVPVNCFHLGTQLAEARLFGHRKGAFTGATQDSPGFVHEAHGGTLFLDEVGELPIEAQANLFRFLDSGQFRRVGSTELEKANVRVIAATNQDLSKDTRFRHELYHRLGTVIIDLPPLSERGNDVLHIARCRVAELNVLGGITKVLSAESEKKLLAHDWPGNVRELLNVIDRAWHASSQEIAGDVLRFDRGVPLHMVASLGWAPDLQPDVVDLDESVNRYTARLVHEMLERCNRDTAEAARRLNISERTVYRWMKRNNSIQDSAGAGSGPA